MLIPGYVCKAAATAASCPRHAIATGAVCAAALVVGTRVAFGMCCPIGQGLRGRYHFGCLPRTIPHRLVVRVVEGVLAEVKHAVFLSVHAS